MQGYVLVTGNTSQEAPRCNRWIELELRAHRDMGRLGRSQEHTFQRTLLATLLPLLQTPEEGPQITGFVAF